MGGCIFHYNQDHRPNSGSITDLVCLTHDPDDNAALVGLIGCSFRFRGYAPAELEIFIRIDHSSMNTYAHCCASKLCFALPCCRDVTRGAPSPESNDPTCGGSDGGTEVTAAPPHRTDLLPRAHNCRASAHVYATGDCGDERQRQWRRRSGAGRFFFWFWWYAIFLIQENCTQVATARRNRASGGGLC